MKMSIKKLVLVFSVVGLFASVAQAQNWPHWRGPNFNGATASSGGAKLPDDFSPSNKVKWMSPLPGPAAATPIVWEDRVFVSAADTSNKTLVALCLDAGNGKVLWEDRTGTGVAQDNRSNYASSSPVTDGKLVVFFYGNGDLAAFDRAGKKLWARNLQKDYGEFAFLWTFSTSPLLHDGRLIMQVLQRDEPASGRGRKGGPNDSYLLALDPKSGKELWRQIRPAEARAESLESFTSPIPFTFEGRSEILVAGGDDITGHDPASGKELWRWGTWNPTRISHWRLVPSPVAGAGIILVCAPKSSPVYALKTGGKGKLSDDAIVWKSNDKIVTSDVSTPLFYQDHFFILNSDKKTISKVVPASGKVLWTGELPSRPKIEASPTAVDGKIYVMNHRGEVFVISAGAEYKLLHSSQFGGEGDTDLRSSIPLAQGNLFIRTSNKLYCISSN